MIVGYDISMGLSLPVSHLDRCTNIFLSSCLQDNKTSLKKDPFFESQENHNLIGVANVYLAALFYDVKLDYQVPIVSQQGEVSLATPVSYPLGSLSACGCCSAGGWPPSRRAEPLGWSPS